MKKEIKTYLAILGAVPVLAVVFVLFAGFIPFCMFIVSRVGTSFTKAVFPHL
jgi:hypothetical protein